jgi:hypothetical protein
MARRRGIIVVRFCLGSAKNARERSRQRWSRRSETFPLTNEEDLDFQEVSEAYPRTTQGSYGLDSDTSLEVRCGWGRLANELPRVRA